MSFRGAILSEEYKEKGHLFSGMQILKGVVQRKKMDDEARKLVVKELAEVVGPDNCTDNPAVLASYSLFPVVTPEIAVLPESVEQVQGILRIANKRHVPVTPLASSTVSLSSGVFIPNGIALDCSRMHRILDINTDEAYALIEPGVTYGQLCSALQAQGYWYPLGSFHYAVSVLGPTTTQNHGGRGYGGWDEVASFEVVLPDGTVVRTGGSMAPKGSWAHQYVNFPDLHGLWLESNGLLGVITKLAVRIYPKAESNQIHIAGFKDSRSAQEFVKRICRQGVARHQVIFWWHGLTLFNHFALLEKHKLDEVGTLPFEWIIRGRTPPNGVHYNTVVTELKGYREVVEASAGVCDRVAREIGGEPIPWDEFGAKNPGLKSFLEEYGIKKQPQTPLVNLITKSMGAFSTIPIIWPGIGGPERILELEEYFWKEMALKKDMGVWFAYAHPFDQGRCFFSRIYIFRFGENQQRMLMDALENADFNSRIVREFGCFPHKPPIFNLDAKMILDQTGGYGELLKRIKEMIDPNNIMSPHVNPFADVPELPGLGK